MKYRVMVTGYAGMPDFECSTHRWLLLAMFDAWLLNITNPHTVQAYVEEIES